MTLSCVTDGAPVPCDPGHRIAEVQVLSVIEWASAWLTAASTIAFFAIILALVVAGVILGKALTTSGR